MNEVARRARVSRSSVDRADAGYSLSPDQQRALHDLLLWARERLPSLVPSTDECAPAVRTYRRALFQVVVQVLADFPREPGALPAEDRDTQLRRDVIASVGRGRPAFDVVSDLRRAYRASSIRRAARALDVRVVAERDGQWWYPPAGLVAPATSHQFGAPTPLPRQPRSASAREVADAISVVLGRRPECTASGPYVVEMVKARLPHVSQSTIYRIARVMRLVRSVSGFGRLKKSVWTLPPAPVEVPHDRLAAEIGEPDDDEINRDDEITPSDADS